MKKIVSNSDFLSGLLFITLGGAFFLISLDYGFGTTREMGPGFFPRLLSIGVVAIGLVQSVKGLRASTSGSAAGPSLYWRPAVFVLGGMAAFALLLRPFGLVAATVAVVVISGLVAPDRRLREIALAAIALAVFAALVFVKALGVVMPLWPKGF